VRTKRLLWQLYPWFVLTTLVSLAAAGFYGKSIVEGLYHDHERRALSAVAEALQDQVEAALAAKDYAALAGLCHRIRSQARMRVTVILPSGQVVADSDESPLAMDNHSDREEIRQAMAEGSGSAVRYSYTLKHEMLYVAARVARRGQVLGVVRTAGSASILDRDLVALETRVGLAGLVVALLAAATSLWVSRRISRPMEEIRRGAEQLARGDLRYKLPIPASSEAAAVAEALNEMAAQLDARTQDVLRQRNEWEAILSSMVEGVLAIDEKERVISVNQAGASLLGVDPAKVPGRMLQEVVRNGDLQRLAADVLGHQRPASAELTVLTRDGQQRQLHAQGTVLGGPQERPQGALLVLHDITQLRRLESVRRDFVANVSHELRTPVTSIKGFVETLLDGAMHQPADNERFLRIIAAQTNRLQSIIDDLLALSRLEQDAEKEAIATAPALVRPVLEGAAGTCRLKADAKKIPLEIECDEALSAEVNAALLEQAVMNLIDNAVKYSPAGQPIRIAAACVENELVISVEDHGCGIAREHLPRIFERFYRVDRARSRELGGTGLGLSIVKHISQAHGGYAAVQSTVGEGSLFSIHLPLGGTAAEQ
jgi:two-component system phosphate regulon sensor histidine kinase PhoR